MNIYDLMTDDLGKVKEFEAACEDMINSRYILVDSKIIRILQCVALSTVLQSIIGGALKGFDYIATEREWSNSGKVQLPSTEKEHVALVFCILADIDNHRIKMNDFLRNFFWNGDINMAYATFCSTLIAPFKRYVVGALEQAHGEQQKQSDAKPDIAVPRINTFEEPLFRISDDGSISKNEKENNLRLPPNEQTFKTTGVNENNFRLQPKEPTYQNDETYGENLRLSLEEPTYQNNGTYEENFRLPPEEPTYQNNVTYEENFRLPPEEPTYQNNVTYEDNFRLPPEEPIYQNNGTYEENFRLPPEEPTYQNNVTYEDNFRLPPEGSAFQSENFTNFNRKINNLADAIERYLYESREIKDEYIFMCDSIASAANTDRAAALQNAIYLKNLLGHVPEIMPYINDVIDELN